MFWIIVLPLSERIKIVFRVLKMPAARNVGFMIDGGKYTFDFVQIKTFSAIDRQKTEVASILLSIDCNLRIIQHHIIQHHIIQHHIIQHYVVQHYIVQYYRYWRFFLRCKTVMQEMANLGNWPVASLLRAWSCYFTLLILQSLKVAIITSKHRCIVPPVRATLGPSPWNHPTEAARFVAWKARLMPPRSVSFNGFTKIQGKSNGANHEL